ncbi:MAG: hypothetical protein PHH91_02565 [Desulfuromonadaceae bacterium]|nr:hypothetical protein [Desulfuromonadaceae bacterium]
MNRERRSQKGGFSFPPDGALLKTYPGLAGLLIALLLMCGCATGTVNSKALRRVEGVGALSKGARIGMTEFTVCGGSYLDKLNLDYHDHDVKALFYHKCTKIGHPQTFSDRLRMRLEEKLGRKIILVKEAKPFKPNLVLRDANRMGLEYVVAGDLLYLGEAEGKTVVSALLYLMRVSDGKLVVVGWVKKDGAIGKVLGVIDDVADELFDKTYGE